MLSSTLIWGEGGGGWPQRMRRKNNAFVAVANNGKLRQRFTPGVPRTFEQDCRGSELWGFCPAIADMFHMLLTALPPHPTTITIADQWMSGEHKQVR